MPNEYLETEMRLIDKSSDQLRLCGWAKEMQNLNEAQICAVPTYHETKTLVFKEDLTAERSLPVLVKDDPEIESDPIIIPRKGYTGNSLTFYY